MADPAKKAEYKAIAAKLKLPNAYTAALTDYMRNAEIEAVDTRSYSKEGEVRVMVSKKGFEVADVQLIIEDEDGASIEDGGALREAGGMWVYRGSADSLRDRAAYMHVFVKVKAGNSLEKRFKIRRE